jgi:hypothetical protein
LLQEKLIQIVWKLLFNNMKLFPIGTKKFRQYGRQFRTFTPRYLPPASSIFARYCIYETNPNSMKIIRMKLIKIV